MSHHGSEDNFMTAGGSDSFWEPETIKEQQRELKMAISYART